MSLPPPARPLPVRPLLHPLHALLLAWPVALFPAALITDVTYLNTAEAQWTNFSQWLITGALLFGGLALLWAIICSFREKRGSARGRSSLYAFLLAFAWFPGLLNAFQHSRDAWSSVGTGGLILSIISSVAALAAAWVAHRGYREGAL